MTTIPIVHRPLCASVAAEPMPVRRRLAWFGVTLAAATILVASWPGATAGILALLLPDLPLLVPGAWAERGRLKRWAVPLYNTTHALAGPLTLMLIGGALTLAGAGDTALGIAAGWLVHVAIDRAVGYDLRTADGLIRT
ncbi:MAG: DUF4260 family protein [Nocardioides sp.]